MKHTCEARAQKLVYIYTQLKIKVGERENQLHFLFLEK